MNDKEWKDPNEDLDMLKDADSRNAKESNGMGEHLIGESDEINNDSHLNRKQRLKFNNGGEETSSLYERVTSVGTSTGKRNIIILASIICAIFLGQSFVRNTIKEREAKKNVVGGHKDPETVKKTLQSSGYKVANDDGSRVSVLPILPELPKIEAPKIIPPNPKRSSENRSISSNINMLGDISNIETSKNSKLPSNYSLNPMPNESTPKGNPTVSSQPMFPPPPGLVSNSPFVPSPASISPSFSGDKVKKYSAPMVAFGGATGQQSSGNNVQNKSADTILDGSNNFFAPTDDSTDFVSSIKVATGSITEGRDLTRTAAPQITNSIIGLSDRIIRQGTTVDIILETEIDTDLPGMIRGMLSKDVFSMSGDYILLPKGSTIIGTYETNTSVGQVRLGITWTRLIRTDGVDIILDIPAVDQLGRSGVMADAVDDKIIDAARGAVLYSTITVANNAISGMVAPNNNGASGGAGSSVGSGSSNPITGSGTSGAGSGSSDSSTQSQVTDGVNKVTSQVKNSFVASLKPAIHIDHGRHVQAMVNKDIVLLSNSAFVYKVGGVK